MLSEKPWKIQAILRLGASILICIFLGTLVVAAIQFFDGSGKVNPILFWAAAAGALGAFSGALYTLRRTWPYQDFIRNYLVLMGCCCAGLVLTWWVMHALGSTGETQPSTLRIVVAVLGFQGAALLLVSRFLREHGTGWREGFGLKIDWPRALLLGLVFTLVFLPIGWGLQLLSGKVMERLHVNPEEQTAVEVLRTSGTLLNGIVLGIAAVILAPLAEETIFRGILYPAIKQRGFPQLALWGTSIAFGAIHFNGAALLPLIVLAVILTQLYEKTGNLLAPIITHSLFNALNFAMVYILPNKLGPPGSP